MYIARKKKTEEDEKYERMLNWEKFFIKLNTFQYISNEADWASLKRPLKVSS